MRHLQIIFPVFALLLLFSQNVSAQQSTPRFKKEWLDKPTAYGAELEKAFKIVETKKVAIGRMKGNLVILKNGYAESKISNPDEWKKVSKQNRPIQVEVIFTRYPQSKEAWLTNFHLLLAERLKALFAIDPALNAMEVRYSMVLQTECSTDEEARALFHGIIVRYEPKKGEKNLEANVIDLQDEPGELPGHSAIRRFIKLSGGIGDSGVYKIYARNNAYWKDAAVVMDLSGSMYQYSPQTLLWHYDFIDSSNIKYFAFFNDGDAKYDSDKKIGSTGGIYSAAAGNMSKVMRQFNTSMRNGMGGDIPENDVEALIKTLETFPDAKSLVLVADNSPIRDHSLMTSLKIPVHVILADGNWGINPQYLNLAFITQGSFHTPKGDYFRFWEKHDKDDVLRIEKHEFIIDPKTNLYRCKDLAYCEYIDSKTLEMEMATLEELKKKPVYRRMHKDQSEKPGIWNFLKNIFGN